MNSFHVFFFVVDAVVVLHVVALVTTPSLCVGVLCFRERCSLPTS